MSTPHRICLLAGVVLLLIAGVTASNEPPVRTGPLVLLRNGHVLYGELTNLGDRCLVALDGGGEVRIAAKEVVIACETLDEAYRHLAQQTADRRGAGPRVALAKWCLRHELLEEAARETAFAEQLDPRHRELAGLRRQLEHAQKLAAEAAASGTRAVAAKSAAASPATVRPAANVRPLVSPEQLETTMEALPKDSVHLFTNTIQPLLLQRCAGGRCHDANSTTGLALLRPTAGAQIWRRLTLRNLHSAVQMLDRAQPQNSKLLTFSREPHGGTGVSVMPEDSAAYQQLFVWVHRAAGTLPATKKVQLAAAEEPVDGPEPPDSPAPRDASSPPKVLGNAIENANPLPPADALPAENLGEDGERERPDSAAKATFQPRDPFDPEIFNRRFR